MDAILLDLRRTRRARAIDRARCRVAYDRNTIDRAYVVALQFGGSP